MGHGCDTFLTLWSNGGCSLNISMIRKDEYSLIAWSSHGEVWNVQWDGVDEELREAVSSEPIEKR